LQKIKPAEIHTFAVDADIIAYRCAAACDGKEPDELLQTIDGFIDNVVRETQVSNLAMFLSGKKNFRYDMAKTKPYKGNREKIIRPDYLGDAKDYIESCYGGYIEKNYEADDCIASFMIQNEGVAHAGIDKDIRQVEGWHYNFVKKHWEHTNEEDSILKLYRQVCMGDSSDHIPGLPRIGEKKAEKAIQYYESARDDAIALYKEIMWLNKEMLSHFKGDFDSKVMQFFEEQYALISMVESLDIPSDICIEHIVVPVFAEQEGFKGVEDKEIASC